MGNPAKTMEGYIGQPDQVWLWSKVLANRVLSLKLRLGYIIEQF